MRRAAATPRSPGRAAVGREMKPVGKPDAGNLHVRFDERGRETGCCHKAQATAPVLDSTPHDGPRSVRPALSGEGAPPGRAPSSGGAFLSQSGSDADTLLGHDLPSTKSADRVSHFTVVSQTLRDAPGETIRMRKVEGGPSCR